MKNKKHREPKNIGLTLTNMKALQTLFYIFHVVFVLTFVYMIKYYNIIEQWHVIFLDIVGLACVLSNKFEFDYSEQEESEDDNE